MAPSPNEEIWNFLAGLPEPLRAMVFSRVLNVFRPEISDAVRGDADLLRVILFPPEPMDMAGAAILMIGAVEYAISDVHASNGADRLISTGNAALVRRGQEMQTGDALMPEAQAAWRQLRESDLAPAALLKYQHSQGRRGIGKA